MKITSGALILASSILFAFGVAADGDDGSNHGFLLVAKTVNEGQGPQGAFKSSSEIEFRFRGDRGRMDVYFGGIRGVSGLHQTAIYNVSEGTIITLHHREKTYTVSTREDQEEQKRILREQLLSRGLIPATRPVLVATGESMNIAGYNTLKYTAQNTTQFLIYWVANDSRALEAQQRMNEILSAPAGELANLRFPDPALFPGAIIRHEIRTRGAGDCSDRYCW